MYTFGSEILFNLNGTDEYERGKLTTISRESGYVDLATQSGRTGGYMHSFRFANPINFDLDKRNQYQSFLKDGKINHESAIAASRGYATTKGQCVNSASLDAAIALTCENIERASGAKVDSGIKKDLEYLNSLINNDFNTACSVMAELTHGVGCHPYESL